MTEKDIEFDQLASRGSLYSNLIEQIKEINSENLSDDVDEEVSYRVVEKQKIYYWIRLYLKEEISDIKPGDNFEICYKFGEKLTTKFVAFGKKNLNRDLDNVIINYDPEDNKKCIILMVDEEDLTVNSEKIPFIRTLFKTYGYYEFQVYRREDLAFRNTRTSEVCEYVDVDF